MIFPEEWIEPLQKLCYTTIDKLKEVEKSGKLANDLNGYNKKNKLDLPGLSPEIVENGSKNNKSIRFTKYSLNHPIGVF